MNIFEWIIRNRKFTAIILAFMGTMWFLNRLLLSSDFSGTIIFTVLTLAKYILAVIMLLPTGFTQLLLGQGPFVVTPTNVGLLVLLFTIVNIAVFGAVGYFAYQFLTFRGKYGKTLGKTLLEFLQAHASLSDLFSRTADFASNNKFYSVVVFSFLVLLVLGGILPKSQYFVFVNTSLDGKSYSSITRESFNAWEKSPETIKTVVISVTDNGVQKKENFTVEKSDFQTVGGLLEFVVPRTLNAVFPTEKEIGDTKKQVLSIIGAEPYAATFSTGIISIVDSKFKTMFSGSGRFITDGASGPEVGKIYKTDSSQYSFYPDYVTDKVHYETMSAIPNTSLRATAYLLSLYSRQRFLTHNSEMEKIVTEAVYNKKLESLKGVSVVDNAMASTFNQLLALALLLLFGMFNRILVLGLMVRRIFTGKDIEFSDGRKMQFGDTALRDIDKDTGEFLQSEEDKKMEMTELRSGVNSVGMLSETADIAGEIDKLGLATVLGNIDSGKTVEFTFDPKEYARQQLANEAEQEITQSLEDRLDEEQKARDEEISKVYRAEMDNFLVYSDTDSEEEKIIKNEYYEKRAALEKGNAEKSSLEQLKEKFEKRLENEQKREVLQKELAEMDSRAITLKKLIDEETDPVTRDKLISDLEQVEQQRVSKYNELIDVTDFSYALEDKKKEAQETILNNRTEGASILEALKTETDEGKRETMQSRLKELSSEERRLKEIIGIQNLRDSQKSLISDAEKIERKIVLQEEEKGYEHELKILKELKKEKKARGDDVQGVENEIEKISSKIGNVRENILQISDENDANILNEARENIKKFSNYHEHEKNLVEKREEIKSAKRDTISEKESLSIKEGDIIILRKKLEDTKIRIASEKNLQKKQILMMEKKQMEDDLKQFESDRDKIRSNLELLDKKVIDLNNEEIDLFKRFRSTEEQMSKSREEGGFGFGDISTWGNQEKEWKDKSEKIKERIRSKYIGDHAEEIKRKLAETNGIISKAAMDDAIQNKFRIDSELSSVNDKIQEKESMVDENTRNIKIAEKKVLETIWKSDNSKKREEVDNRVSGLMSEKQEAFSQFTKKLREDKLSEASVEERTSQIFEASQNALRAKAIAASSAEELKKTENFLIKKISDEGDERLKANMSKELEIIRGEMASKISEVEQSSLEAQEAVTEQSAAVETLKSKIRAYGNTINGRTATNELEALKKRIIENDRALVNEYKVVQGEYERLRKEVASYSEGTKEYMEAESKMMAMMNEINEKGYIERHEANKKALELAKS